MATRGATHLPSGHIVHSDIDHFRIDVAHRNSVVRAGPSHIPNTERRWRELAMLGQGLNFIGAEVAFILLLNFFQELYHVAAHPGGLAVPESGFSIDVKL